MSNIYKVVLAALLSIHSGHADTMWSLISEESEITFTSTYDDITFNGAFEKFTVDLTFTPSIQSSSSIKSSVDVTSINTKSRDRDQALAEKDWFYFNKFPQATFTSGEIKHQDNNQLLVMGILQIRDQKRELALPMNWKRHNNRLQLKANFELDRRDFNIGSGEWAEDETIGFTTNVFLSFMFEKISNN